MTHQRRSCNPGYFLIVVLVATAQARADDQSRKTRDIGQELTSGASKNTKFDLQFDPVSKHLDQIKKQPLDDDSLSGWLEKLQQKAWTIDPGELQPRKPAKIKDVIEVIPKGSVDENAIRPGMKTDLSVKFDSLTIPEVTSVEFPSAAPQQAPSVVRPTQAPQPSYPSSDPHLSTSEIILSIATLTFAALAQLGLVFLVYHKRINTSTFFHFGTLTLVITCSLFLIVSGYTQEQIGPVIGLFGTIAGYVLGRGEQRKSARSKPRPPSESHPISHPPRVPPPASRPIYGSRGEEWVQDEERQQSVHGIAAGMTLSAPGNGKIAEILWKASAPPWTPRHD